MVQTREDSGKHKDKRLFFHSAYCLQNGCGGVVNACTLHYEMTQWLQKGDDKGEAMDD